jgi:hypothetical protein
MTSRRRRIGRSVGETRRHPMSTLTTKVTITLATAVAGLGAAATPVLADDGATVTASTVETLTHVIHWGGRLVAALVGVVLLTKLLQGYRRSQWRRRWIERSTVLYVGSAQLGWPSGSISGRSTRPSAGLSSMASPLGASPLAGVPLAGSSVARSATRL